MAPEQKTALEGPPPGEGAAAHARRGLIAFREGRPTIAAEAFRHAMEHEPINPQHPYLLAAAEFSLGRLEQAEAALKKTLELNPRQFDARKDLAKLFAGQRRFEDAVAHYRQALATRPDDADTHLHLATALANLGRHEEASRHGELALRFGPDHAEARRQLGQSQARRGRPAEAVAHYQRALALRPDDPEILNELGIAFARLHRLDEAADCYRRAIRARPEIADVHNNLGNLLRQRGRLDEAIACYREALRLRPNYPEAHNNLGIALRRQGKVDEAIHHYYEALRLRPDYADAHNNLGFALASRGKHEAAVAYYHQAIRLRPDYVEAHHNLASALSDLGRHADAVNVMRQAVRLRPKDAKLHKTLGMILARKDDFGPAQEAYHEALTLRPDFPEVYNDLGIIAARQHRYQEALEHYEQALRLRPDYAEVYSNLGNALRNLGRYDESVAAYRKAIELRPNYADAYNNLGITLSEMGRCAEAIDCYTSCLKHRPNHNDAAMNQSLTWLRMGDLLQGCPAYNTRWRRRAVSSRPLIRPEWNGAPLAGRRILLITEQGLGDTFHFIRYAKRLKEQGATVILECPEKLLRILARTPGIDVVVPQGQEFPDYDVWCPLLSLMGVMHTTLETIPAEVPYIHPDPDLVEHWRQEMSAYPGFKVGINWQGNPQYGGDRNRSMPLICFEPLARVPGVKLFSLQKNQGKEQLQALRGRFEVIDLGVGLDEASGPFMDTAAVMKNLDLFVTSDTAVAHLAGALSVPVWMATSWTAGWQWLLEREDSPWYPTMRLFRQARPLEWVPVFERIAAELRAFAPPPLPEPIRTETTVAELLDRIAVLQVEAEYGSDPDPARARLASLEAVRDRSLLGVTGLDDLAQELRNLHEALWRGEQTQRSLERDADFGVRYLTLARSLADHRGRREDVLHRMDALAPRR
jgi:Flp pilus assembly protein TadD